MPSCPPSGTTHTGYYSNIKKVELAKHVLLYFFPAVPVVYDFISDHLGLPNRDCCVHCAVVQYLPFNYSILFVPELHFKDTCLFITHCPDFACAHQFVQSSVDLFMSTLINAVVM